MIVIVTTLYLYFVHSQCPKHSIFFRNLYFKYRHLTMSTDSVLTIKVLLPTMLLTDSIPAQGGNLFDSKKKTWFPQNLELDLKLRKSCFVRHYSNICVSVN
jgi:hypothetical protein